jgi:hypothetical protein
MSLKYLFIFFLLISQYVFAATTLNWPSSGGIEEWGFSRPYSCSSDDKYLMSLANRMHEQSNWGSVNGVYNAQSGEYTSGRTGQLIQQAKTNPQAISALQEELDKLKTEINQLDKIAENYIQLTSSGYRDGGDVIKAIKRFEVIGKNCISTNSKGDSNAIACNLQAAAFKITANIERFVQISCHLGGNVPTYAMASMPNNKVSSINTSEPSNVAKPDSKSGSALLGVLGAVADVYLNNQASKSNSRSRNAQVSQTVPQIETRTQTSQNNSPSDNTYEQSSNSGSSSSGSGFVYDSSDHSRCIAVSADLNKRRVNYKNNCNYPVYMQFCQVTDDSSSYSQFQDGARCPGGWPGMRIQANGSDFVRAWNDFNNYRFFMYVCKDGWSPVNQNGKPLFLINESYTCRMLK